MRTNVMTTTHRRNRRVSVTLAAIGIAGASIGTFVVGVGHAKDTDAVESHDIGVTRTLKVADDPAGAHL